MRVAPPNLGPWMVAHVRAQVRAAGINAQVGSREPDDLGRTLPITRPMIVIRDDSGSRLDLTTFDRSLGATIFAGTKSNPGDADDLAQLVAAIMFDSDLPLEAGSPIASVVFSGCNGPYPVTETLDVARRYLTAQYVASGSW